MIRPALQDDAFLADVAAARTDGGRDHLDLWWLGQSGFLVCHQHRCLLLDPYLSDALTRKYAATDKPHVRMTERVVDPARLRDVSLVTSSHLHTDHFDAETLRPVLSANPQAKLLLPSANRISAVERLGAEYADRLVPLDPAATATVAGFECELVPAAHEERSPAFAGFVVRSGPFTIYHSGDTVLFPGMVEGLKGRRIDVALLPINGRAPERRVAGNLNGEEAAQLACDIGARWAVPCHYDMFTFNTASPDAFVARCRQLKQPQVVLPAGQRWTLHASA